MKKELEKEKTNLEEREKALAMEKEKEKLKVYIYTLYFLTIIKAEELKTKIEAKQKEALDRELELYSAKPDTQQTEKLQTTLDNLNKQVEELGAKPSPPLGRGRGRGRYLALFMATVNFC